MADDRAPASTASAAHPLRAVGRHPVLATLALLAMAGTALVLLWDWNWFRGLLERQVEARTGRTFDIDGDLDVDLGWSTTVSLDRVRFGNAPWSRVPVMAEARRAEIDIAVRPLFRGNVVVPAVRLDRPRLLLEAHPTANGGNWDFGTEGGGQARLRQLKVRDGALRFVDVRERTDIRVAVNSGAARPGEAAPIVARGGGRWRGNAFTVDGRAESPLRLQDIDRPYRVDVRARAGATRAHARGTLLDPLRLRDFDLRLALSGRNLEDLYPLLGLSMPPTPPYTLDGRFSRDIEGPRTTWRYEGFNGRVGDSDLSGTAHVTTGGPRPVFRGDLRSRRLDFDDLAGFVGAAPQAGETTNAELAAEAARDRARTRVLPDDPYRLDKLNRMDADVRLRAQRIDAPGLPLEDMDAHLTLVAGRLKLAPLDFGVAGGRIRSTVEMDARRAPIRTRAKLDMRGLQLAELLPNVKLAGDAVGRVGGRIALTGRGNSIAAMLGTSEGDVAIGMGEGRISNLLMEFAGIDIAEIVKFKLTEDRKVPVRCAFADFEVRDGVMRARSLAFDTTDTILVGTGSVSLRDETLDLRIRPRPKDRSLLSLRSPLLVQGTFKAPEFRPDYGRIGLRGAVALALGSIAPPAALLATLELGPGEDARCGGRYAK